MARELMGGTGLVRPQQATTPYDDHARFRRGVLQKQFETEWNNASRDLQRGGAGQQKINSVLDRIHAKYRVQALGLTEDIRANALRQPKPTAVQAKMSSIDELVAGGLDPGKAAAAKAQIQFGVTPAETMGLAPKEVDPRAEFGRMDVHRNRIEARLEDFRVRPGGPGKRKLRTLGFTRGESRTTELEVFDPSLMGEDSKGEFTGKWRKATLDEIQEYGALTSERSRISAAQRPMMSGLMNTAVKSRRMGGAISDQAKAYIRDRAGRQEQKASPRNDDPLGLR
jgi:hypothetical protein